ncbi:insulinase family protein [Candidatus Dependentiae bacterium]|nr:insulinase family protein [Candidatus Dependentiae bacterium]
MSIVAAKKVFKKVLNNGLTILVRPNQLIPKVSLQMWYNVGSKDEKTGQKGIAHLIEHMIFKGTKKLSESDINLIVNKLSGSCNAFTSYDYTGYLFDMPSQHWHEALPIMEDCMVNCTFRQEFLNSEMKAVIQELKMYKDNYPSTIVEALISAIFYDHPYHFPIIGFKQDLWNMKRDALVNFYKTHYVTNNATLVVTGDVSADDVFERSESIFGDLKPNPDYKKEEFYHHLDLMTQSITLYRDVQQPIVMLAFVVPGAKAQLDYPLDVLAWILGSGKSSRLAHKLIDDLQLVTELDTFTYDLFDYGVFFIYFQPKKVTDIDLITRIIHDEISSIVTHGLNTRELQRAIKKTHMEYLSVLESNQKQAYVIGQSYLATGNEQFLFNYLDYPTEQLNEVIKNIASNFIRPSLMHKGTILPIVEQDKDMWLMVQKESDAEDARVLKDVVRDVPVEAGSHVHNVPIAPTKSFNFPRPERLQLANGLTVLYYHNPNTPTIDGLLMLKAKSYYDPAGMEGLYAFMTGLLDEGTKTHPGSEFSEAVESYGMSLSCSPGYIALNMLSADLEQGLGFITEMMSESSFDEDAIEKVREQLVSDVKDYWDSPSEFTVQLAREEIYKNHPYSKRYMGDIPTLEKIKKDDLIRAYKQFATPNEATLVLVGDLESYNIKTVLEKTIAKWQGAPASSIAFPTLHSVKPREIVYQINRDQIVLGFAGLSVARSNPDFDKILLFDQIFTGGVLGSMSSRLFQLREQSGLFYTIGGSLLHHADEQPGMVFVKTIVSLDRVDEAQQAILETIDHATDQIEDSELEQAQNGLINSMVDNFESNRQIAATFALLERYKLPADYFDKRPGQLLSVNKEDICTATRKVLSSEKLVRLKVGRI